VAHSKGLSLSDSGLLASPMQHLLPPEVERLRAFEPILSEEDIFRALGIEYIPPNERKNYGPEKVDVKEFEFHQVPEMLEAAPDMEISSEGDVI
jgi:hypothetical protein